MTGLAGLRKLLDQATPIGFGLCECGCGRTTPIASRSNSKYGHIKGEPVRYIVGHGNSRPAIDRFIDKVLVMPDGCWQWTGGKRRDYGTFSFRSRSWIAHRFAYEVFVGPIPDGLTIDHLCRNPSCVNPTHLEPTTIWENTSRGEAVTARNARKTHCKRGHPFDERNTHVTEGVGRRCRECARLRFAGELVAVDAALERLERRLG